MKIFLVFVLLISVSLNIYLYIDLVKVQLLLSLRITELKKTNIAYREELERYGLQEEAAEIRDLGFKKQVKYSVVGKREVSDIVKREIEKGFTGIDERVLKKFGFLNPDEEVLSRMTALYNEQVQGMYNEETNEMIMVEGIKLSGNIQKMFLVHELTHVLQDQNFNLKTLPLYSDNDDEALSALSLIEGDATLAMFEYYKINLKIYKIFWDLFSYLSVDQSKLYESPYYLRENLIFPYKWGTKFVTSIYIGSGWKGMDEVYKNPPKSTEEIMHPEKYLLDRPLVVSIEEIIHNWELLDTNTMGEFNTRVLLSIYLGEYESIIPSQGWGGDKWQVWENKETGRLKVIWYTKWDTKKDADEFFDAFKKLLRKRHIPEARICKKDSLVRLYW